LGSEDGAQRRSLAFDVHRQDTSGWYSARRVGMKYSGFKVLVERESGRILGAHVLGIDAAELINVFAIAMRGKLTASDIKQTIFAYPTGASDVGYMV
jgi:glutathione reductase (NADPH)